MLIRASKLAGPTVVQTTIAGDGADAERLRTIVRQEAVTNVRMLGAVPADHVPGLYAASDAGAVLLRDLEIFAGALPTKLLETMAAGRPLVLCARGEAAELVHSASAGLMVDPGDPEGLAEALRWLHLNPARGWELGRSGRAHAEAHFGAGRAADAWAEQLSAAVGVRAGRPRSARAAAGPRRAD